MSFSVILIIFVAIFVLGGRRRRRWEEARWQGREFPGQEGPPWRGGRHAAVAAPEPDGYVESLETRIARLEERLDFTERLLQGRDDKAEPPTQSS